MPFGSTVPVSEPEKPDQEGGDDEGDEKITASAAPEGTEPPDDGKADAAQKLSEEGLTDTAPTVTIPVIGMDGKTKDGAMPYEILKQQLAFLR